jgi:hypothetical protein
MTLRRFNLVADAEAAKKSNRDYMQSHRDEWSSLGFRNITYMVHDSERELVLAELDVRRCDKLIAIAEDKRTAMAIMESLARRNMPKSPLEGTIVGMKEEASESTSEKEVLATMDIAANMLKKQAALITLFGKTDDRDQRTRIAARGVAYSSSASARYKLARAILDYAPPKPRAVFGLDGSKAVAEQEAWEEDNG